MAVIGLAGAATASYVAGIAAVAAYGVVTAAVIGALAGAVVSGIIASVLIDKPSAANFNATAFNVLLNKKANNAPIPVIYGTRRVGGIIVFMATKDKSTLNISLVVSEGEIEEYTVFYFDGKRVSPNSEIFIDEYFGTGTQIANSGLISNYSYYKSTHRLQGTAYLSFQIEYNREKYPTGIPLINVIVKGVKVYDPRTQATAWTDNPVLCIRDYLTNERYGRGINASLIDDTSFILAANYCEELVSYNGINFRKRYTCNGVVETQNSSLDIIKQLLSSCRGILIFSGGLYKVIIDKPEMAVFTFSEDNIIGGWKIKLGDKKTQFNRMRTNFFNASKEYQPDIAIVDSEELRKQDGVLLETMTSLPFNTDLVRATAITKINLNQSRHTITCELTATIEALRVEVGDVVYINHKTPGWDTHNSNLGKKFRIMRVTIQNNDEVRILASEYADEVYDIGIIDYVDQPVDTDGFCHYSAGSCPEIWVFGAYCKASDSQAVCELLSEKGPYSWITTGPGTGTIPIINLDDLSFCLPPTNLQVDFSSTDIVRGGRLIGWDYHYTVSWTKSTDAHVSSYEVQYNYNSSVDTIIDVGNVSNYIITVRNDANVQLIKIRAINTIGVYSEFVT